MKTLTLPIKGKYFRQIVAGEKLEEYRLATPYWARRLEGRSYDRIEITLGYPKRDDKARRAVRIWNDYTVKQITHEHFGPDPVTVYAIDVSEAAQ